MSGHCKKCGVYHEEDDDRLCTMCQQDEDADCDNLCDNCKKPIPQDTWACADCMSIFDGERFHNELRDK